MAEMSIRRFSGATLLATTLLSLGCDQGVLPAQPPESVGKPDLVIDNITYTRVSRVVRDQYGGILIGPPTIEFTLSVRNNGTSSVTSPLFVCNSHSRTDFDAHYCSSGRRTNDPPVAIPAGGSLDVKLVAYVDPDVPKVLFILNTSDIYHENVNLPMIEEVSYDNNSFVVALDW